MNFVTSLLKCPQNSFLLKATEVLKKEGQSITKTLPSGTTVRYIRGKDFEARGFGQKFNLYKEVTKPDNTRYVTNANVIRDDVYVNEVYHIKPNDFVPDYVQWADTYYFMRQPGWSNKFEKKEMFKEGLSLNGGRRPEELAKLLRKKLPTKDGSNPYSSYWEYSNAEKAKAAGKDHFQYEQFHKTENTYRNQKTTGSSTSSSGSTASTKGKITREQFVNHMVEKVAKMKSKELIDIATLRDAEIRNLAKLFGISESEMWHFNKSTKRILLKKFHPDTTTGDGLSEKIFEIVNKLKCIN